MVEKNLQISLLLDFYGQMLTDKQREVVEYYYNEDLSLAEIAAHCGITRQGVRDSIKRAELTLIGCEEKLGLMARFHEIQDGLDEMIGIAGEIQREYGKRALMNDLTQKAQRIIDIAGSLSNQE